MSSPPFPFSALVGCDELQEALLLCAVDPAVGGVLLRGDKGSGKSTAARALARLLPGDAPFVELPLGATEDRVVGAFDLRAVLAHGEHRFQPGLVQSAHRGVLYVDEVNLLPDHLVDVLLDVAASGVNRVERDGISHEHPSRFVLVGSMNPEEGELRPQLLDRFGLAVEVRAPGDTATRVEAVRRRLAFDADPESFSTVWAAQDRALAARLRGAKPAPMAAALQETVAALCLAAGAQGLRADLVICRAAAALAGWEGSPATGPEHVRRVAPLALGHRRPTPWDHAVSPSEGLEQLMAELGLGADSPPDGGLGAGSPPDGGALPEAGGADLADGAEHPARGGDEEASAAQRRPEEASAAQRPPEARSAGRSRAHAPARRGEAHDRIPDAQRGRLVGARPLLDTRPVTALDPFATVVAAAVRNAAAGAAPAPLRIGHEDLREPLRSEPAGRLVVFAVDASGSMGVQGRIAAAKDAVLALLIDAYQRRDRVALVTFHGEDAEVVLRPTASTEVARARLDSVATGGRTPLAAGIRCAHLLALQAGRVGARPLVVVVSDGRATVAPSSLDPLDAAYRAASGLRRDGIESVVVDCEGPRARLGLASALARRLGARHVAAETVTADALVEVVRRDARA